MCSPIANDAVAAGEGALQTLIILYLEIIKKSSTISSLDLTA